MINIDTSSRKEQRNFGLLMAGALLVVTGVRFLHHWWRDGALPETPVILPVLAVVFFVLGLAAPGVLRPVFVAWIAIARGINWTITHVVLTFAFFVLIVPTRVVIRIFGNDPLKRGLDPEAETYWEEPEAQPETIEDYLNQF